MPVDIAGALSVSKEQGRLGHVLNRTHAAAGGRLEVGVQDIVHAEQHVGHIRLDEPGRDRIKANLLFAVLMGRNFYRVIDSGARAGLTSFLAGVCRQVAPDGVTINNILPGKMDTDRLRAGIRWGAEQAGISEDEEARRQADQIPARRFGNPEEFGNLCAFLCSRHAGYLTGQNFLVDGGLVPTAF